MEYEFHVVVATRGKGDEWVWEETSNLYGPIHFEKRMWRYDIINTFIEAGQLPPMKNLTEMFYFRSRGKDIVFFDWETGQPVLAIIHVSAMGDAT